MHFPLIFSLCLIALLSSTEGYKHKKNRDLCPEGYYRDFATELCEVCTDCGLYMYKRDDCTAHSNTQCGWCGSRVVIENDDFRVKCEKPESRDFTIFTEMERRIKERIGMDYEEEGNGRNEVLVKDRKSRRNPSLLNRARNDLLNDETYETYEDYVIAEDEAFERDMEKTLEKLVRKNMKPHPRAEQENQDNHDDEADLMSSEIDDEITPQVVDESDEEEYEEIQEAKEIVPAERVDSAIKILVIGERAQKTKDEEDEYSEEEEGEQPLPKEWAYEEDYQSVKELNRLTNLGLRILMIFSIFIMFLSIYRAVHCYRLRRRAMYIPPLDSLTAEQQDMINRCSKKLETHCYENKLAYV